MAHTGHTPRLASGPSFLSSRATHLNVALHGDFINVNSCQLLVFLTGSPANTKRERLCGWVVKTLANAYLKPPRTRCDFCTHKLHQYHTNTCRHRYTKTSRCLDHHDQPSRQQATTCGMDTRNEQRKHRHSKAVVSRLLLHVEGHFQDTVDGRIVQHVSLGSLPLAS